MNIVSQLSGLHDRKIWAAIMIGSWIASYPTIIIFAAFEPTNLLFIILIAILTSEGFATTTTQIARWASKGGTDDYSIAQKMIHTHFTGNKKLVTDLTEVCKDYEVLLKTKYDSFLNANDASTLDTFCKALATAYKDGAKLAGNST